MDAMHELEQSKWISTLTTQFGQIPNILIKRAKKVAAVVALSQAKQVACFLHRYVRVAAWPSPIPSGDQLAVHESCGAFRR
ncbi:MAG TPA: hypothetical protein VN875_10320 [Candidatus Binatus sp.]|nr:hypothetical protein [Candidatus Binatus sp.]